MRFLKSTAGLTTGSWMTEEMQNLWTLSEPVTSEYNSAMQDFTYLAYTIRPKQNDSTESRFQKKFF
ncbi:hypothetical protein DPMN_089121 [Dreissena polymorpha]|uniref:Uncharacterized protein n=1 Tax=Dreissena polymorpha TaxID=45954 RepID=A0A9D4KWC0_DREPO|nr:hypothetical protein DPMN_089121 [Dreissena polymorpha]